ncbi:MAG TPA: hypothetical protein VNN76_04575 [Bacteroidota bacterium]|nr:hypothetical protein [Bacteroidota bacterium]
MTKVRKPKTSTRSLFSSGFRIAPVSIIMLFLSLLVAWRDMQYAGSSRTLARLVCLGYSSESKQIWFQGHWGFQYYIAECSALPVEWEMRKVRPGDFVAVPFNNANTYSLPPEDVPVIRHYEDPLRVASTTHRELGEGFYLHIAGPLPSVFGRILLEYVTIYERAT